MTHFFRIQVEARLTLFENWATQALVPWAVSPDGKFLRDSDGELVPEYAPLSIPKFCAWAPGFNTGTTALAVQSFEPIRRATLDEHEDLRTRVDTARGVISALLEKQRKDRNKTAIIELQKNELAYLKQVVLAQAKESRLAREGAEAMEAKYRKRHDEQRRNIAQLNEILRARETTIGELTSTISKITPLFSSK